MIKKKTIKVDLIPQVILTNLLKVKANLNDFTVYNMFILFDNI